MFNRLKIAQVSPLYESVPPRLYGGTERIVSYLTEELVNQGHDVTLFASGDSITKAKLVSPCPSALRLNAACRDPLVYHYLLLEKLIEQSSEFDLIHFHIDYLHFPFSQRLQVPHVTTLHGRLDLPDLPPLFRGFPEQPLVSISDDQRKPLSWANWEGTVHHGLPPDLYQFNPSAGKYLAFLGRVSPEKRLDRAIAIAKRAGLPLKVAAKVDAVDLVYFEKEIRPLIANEPLVEFVGEIGEDRKEKFLGEAIALLFPIDWPEPFGLVMIEAMACGTPVIAFHCGAIPEVINSGVNGFVVETMEEAFQTVQGISSISREVCRAEFERRFLVERMANDYVTIYRRLIVEQANIGNGRTPPRRHYSGSGPRLRFGELGTG